MKFTKIAAVTLGLGFLVSGFTSQAAEAKKALVVGYKNYCDMFEVWLQPLGYKTVKISANNGKKDPKEQGFELPKLEEMRQYKLIILSPLTQTLSADEAALIQYIKEGGNVMAMYDVLWRYFGRYRKVGYGICGFDKIHNKHLTPYPKAGHMTHKLKGMGKLANKTYEEKCMVAFYAGDLLDGEALAVNPEFPGLAMAVVAKVGKGQFIFYGSERNALFKDILTACDLGK